MKIKHENGVIDCSGNHLVEIISENDVVSIPASDVKSSDILILRRTEHVFDEQPNEHNNNLAFFWLFGAIQSCGVVEEKQVVLYFEEHRIEYILKALCGLFKIDAFYETIDIPRDERFIRTRTFKITNRVVLKRNELLDNIVSYLDNWFDIVYKNEKCVLFSFLQGVYDVTGASAKSKYPIFSHKRTTECLTLYQKLLEKGGVFSQIRTLNKRDYFTKSAVFALMIGNGFDRNIYNSEQRVGFKRFLSSYSHLGNRYPYQFVVGFFKMSPNAAYLKMGVPVGSVKTFKDLCMVPSKVYSIT